MFVAFIVSAAGSALLLLFPWLMYPAGDVDSADRWMALLVFVIAGTDIALAACAYKFDVGATVRARALVEPGVISIAAAGVWYVSARDGRMLSYAAALGGAVLRIATGSCWVEE